MIRHCLNCLLAALIALQSVVAMADAHRFHQSGTEHLDFNHKHELAEAASFSDTELNAADPVPSDTLDCHHCCHCHGMAHFFLGGSQNSLFAITLGNEVPDYRFAYHSYIGSPDTPPPIC